MRWTHCHCPKGRPPWRLMNLRWMMMPSCMLNSRLTYPRRCRCRSRVVVQPLAQVISPLIPQSPPYCRDSTHLQPIYAIKSWGSASDETLLWVLMVAATNYANETRLLLSLLLLQCLPGDFQIILKRSQPPPPPAPNRDAWPTPINSSCWLGNPIAWFCSGQIDHCGANWAQTNSLTSLWVPTPHKLQQRFKDFSGPTYPICEDWRATLVKCNFISVTIDSNVDVVSTKITESQNRDSICILIHHDVHRLAPIQFCTLVNKSLNLRQAVSMRPTRVDIF